MGKIPRALVVEDDARMRRIVTKVLTGCGFIVRAAVDGLDALNAFRASREEPDLVCADIRMPNMDGREFAKRLRHDGVDVPIVFVSGVLTKDQEGYREKSHVWLVSKPFSPTQLAEVVKEMLAKPRPSLAPRGAAPPVKSAAELPPLPAAQPKGYEAAEFPTTAKPPGLVVPRAPDQPFARPAAAGAAPAAGAAAPAAPRSKKEHETTVIFLKPTSAAEVPAAQSGLGRVGPAPAAPAAAGPKPKARPLINVERRIREPGDGRPAKPGAWTPRLIIWPRSAGAEAAKGWVAAVAGALSRFTAAEKVGCYALAAARPDEQLRLWRMRANVNLDAKLLEAVLERALKATLLLAPAGLPAGAFDAALKAKHLDRANLLPLGAALADLDCSGPVPVVEITFLRGETAFLRALHEECLRTGQAMQRSEWKP